MIDEFADPPGRTGRRGRTAAFPAVDGHDRYAEGTGDLLLTEPMPEAELPQLADNVRHVTIPYPR